MAIKTIFKAALINIIIAQTIMGLTNPSDLVVIPQAITPKRGHVEYGAEVQHWTEGTGSNFHNILFFNLAIDNYLEVGMKSSSEFDTLFAAKALLTTFNYKKTTHFIAYGTQNLNWTSSNSENFSYPVYKQYLVYTAEIPRFYSYYHIGLGYNRQTEHNHIFAGASYNFKQFETMFEWDGFQVNVGLYYKMTQRFNYFLSITPSPTDKFGTKENFYSIGITTTGSLFQNDEDVDSIKNQQKLINKKLNVLDAKTDMIREFSSLDFLEEFHQFLLENDLLEEELQYEEKTAIRSALDHMQRGLELYYQEEYKSALNEYKRVILLVPNFSIGYTRIGSIYYKLGDLENAKINWIKALELNPKNKNLKVFLEQITPKKDIPNKQLTQDELDKLLLFDNNRL